MLAAILALAVSADPGYTSVTIEEGAHVVRWESEAPVDVLVSTDPDGANARMISRDDSDRVHIEPHDSLSERRYFVIRAQDGAETVTAARLLPLEGGKNFRDLGGYETADGRRVRWGRLYRSGVMSGLTAGDYRYLSGLGIGVVCDFRASSERVAEPTDWRAEAVETLSWDYEIDTSAFAAAFADGMSEASSVAAFTGFYRSIPSAFSDRYADLFRALESPSGATTFHCSAGKDRTGVAAALILTALGVPRETVLADYALSDVYVDYMADIEASRADVAADDPAAFWYALPDEVIAPFMRSDPAYLEAALDQIEADHGGVDAYLTDVLDADLDALRALYLE